MYPIYTYYHEMYGEGMPEEDAEKEKEQREMIRHWKRSWAKRGWAPKVLTQSDAKRHPMFDAFTERVKRLPTVNPMEYEIACYHRWLAVAVMGGGFMADYDVINYSFNATAPSDELVIYEAHYCRDEVTPSCVGGTAYGFMNAVLAFAASDVELVSDEHNGKPHTSDMIVLQKVRDSGLYVIAPTVKSYGNLGWDTAPLVHYSHAATEDTDRVACLRTAREI